VARDENLIDVETDKVVLELPAPSDGVLAEITKPDGSTVMSNDVIAVIDTDAKAAPKGDGGGAAKAATPAPDAATPAAAKPPAPATPAGGNGAVAMPAARKIMADQNVEAASVQGTGRGGRITKGDVIAATEAKAAATQAVTTAAQPTPAAKAPAPAAKPAVQAPAVQLPARSARVPSSACPCHGCASASRNASCSRSRPRRS
jgi:2-oxoglutarate dehydrogenase E2 component (dihydrolipoamide succinyltransferase)